MALIPTLATPAPTSPPISACELLEGMPSAQVMMFQAMAPVSAANTTRGSTISAATIPVPTVCATCAPKIRNATKLKKAAHITACCGRNTRVETMVAIEFAASCSPLRKSKARATVIRAIRIGRASATASMAVPTSALSSVVPPKAETHGAEAGIEPRFTGTKLRWVSHVLDDDAADFISDVVEAVDHRLQMVIDLVADEERHRIGRLIGAVKLTQPDIVQFVGAALDLRNLLADLADAAGIGVDGGEQ